MPESRECLRKYRGYNAKTEYLQKLHYEDIQQRNFNQTLTVRVVNNIQCMLVILVSFSRELSLPYDKDDSFEPINSGKTQFNETQTSCDIFGFVIQFHWSAYGDVRFEGVMRFCLQHVWT